MMEIKKLSISLSNKILLSELNFNIETGQFSVLLGANGVGKSTLLKCLAGLPLNGCSYNGTINYGKHALKSLSYIQLSKQRAVMSQHTQLLFPLSVLDLVQLGRVVTGQTHSYSENRHIAEQALDLVEMSDFAKQNAQTLSGGELQRVHLARVLAQVWPHENQLPALLFLDEPTSSLDLNYQHFMLRLIKRFCTAFGFTALAVLHDVNMAAQYADKLLLLKKPGLLCSGTPTEVLNAACMQQAFGVRAVIQQHPVLHCPQVMTY